MAVLLFMYDFLIGLLHLSQDRGENIIPGEYEAATHRVGLIVPCS